MSFFKRLRSFLRREKLDAELDDELQFHLDQRTQDFIEQGMSREEARYAARRAFGNVGSLKEETRDSWGFRLLETLWQDVRFGARMLVRNPGFTVVAVLTHRPGQAGLLVPPRDVSRRSAAEVMCRVQCEKEVVFGTVRMYTLAVTAPKW